jgi:hypothetical protein
MLKQVIYAVGVTRKIGWWVDTGQRAGRASGLVGAKFSHIMHAIEVIQNLRKLFARFNSIIGAVYK